MTDLLGPKDDGGTGLTEEEREGLIPSYITLRSELNEAEQANILEAEEWAVDLHPIFTHFCMSELTLPDAARSNIVKQLDRRKRGNLKCKYMLFLVQISMQMHSGVKQEAGHRR